MCQAAAAVTATPSTAQRRARRGNFLLERTASSAEKFMCHGINGAGVEAAAASAAAIDVPIETAATSSPPLAPVQSGSSSPPLPAASPMAASIGSGLYEFPMDGAEEAVEITLVACACCSRKFSEQNIAKHEKNCKKQTTKRKAFSAADQRAVSCIHALILRLATLPALRHVWRHVARGIRRRRLLPRMERTVPNQAHPCERARKLGRWKRQSRRGRMLRPRRSKRRHPLVGRPNRHSSERR